MPREINGYDPVELPKLAIKLLLEPYRRSAGAMYKHNLYYDDIGGREGGMGGEAREATPRLR